MSMDWKAFIASIVASVAWPAAVVTLAFVLRKSLRRLIPLLRTVKWKDLELEFAEKLKKAEQEAAEAKLPRPEPVLLETSTTNAKEAARSELRRLATIAPRAAITEAWRQLEWKIIKAIESRGVRPPASMADIMDAVRSMNLLPADAFRVLDDLRRLRNVALHDHSFGIDEARALEFVDLAERVGLALPQKDPPASEQDT